MSDPRNTVSFDTVDAVFYTFLTDNSTILYDITKTNGSSQVGLAVKLSADKTIALTVDGDPVLGKLIKVETDNKGIVQVEGAMTLPGGNGATLTAGTKVVGALGASSAHGYIRSVATATGSYVQGTAQDALNGRGQILDASDSTNVVVNF